MDLNQAINEIASLLVHPFLYVLHPGQRIYVLYLLTAAILAFATYVFAKRTQLTTAKSFLAYCFPRDIYTHASTLLDLKFFFINRIAFALFLGALVLSSTAIAAGIQLLLTTSIGESANASQQSVLALGFLLTITVVIAQDFGIFFAHYLMHKTPLLWEFHKVHHSAQTLTPMTVYRMHPVDDILTGAISGALIGVVYGIFSYGYAGAAQEIKILHLNAVVFVFYVAGYNLRHSHIWLPLKGLWGHLFISPAHHQLHHSSELRHADKNLGFIFGIWDWMAGTLYVPETREEFRLGLHDGEDRDYDSIAALYFVPFKKALEGLRRPILETRS